MYTHVHCKGEHIGVTPELPLNNACDFCRITNCQHYWLNNSRAMVFDLGSVMGNPNAWLWVASARAIMNIHKTYQGHYLPEVLHVI